jgi:hypothetical protein
MKRIGWLALILATLVIPSDAADREFKMVLQAVEKQYGIHHTRLPFVGLIFKFYRPEGVRIASLAVFENLHGKAKVPATDLIEIVSRNLGSNWQPVVRTKSRHDNESSVVYVDTSGTEVGMFVADIERDEATIVKLTMPEGVFREWMEEPDGRKKCDLLNWGSN